MIPRRDLQIFALELRANPRIELITHHHGNQANMGTYGNQSHAVPSPDGKRVFFASDWGGDGSAAVYTYAAKLRR